MTRPARIKFGSKRRGRFGFRTLAEQRAFAHKLHGLLRCRCALCWTPWAEGERYTFDHVWPVGLGGRRGPGNLLLAHERCNCAKGGRRPTGCELIMLAYVNDRLGLSDVSPMAEAA